MALSEQERNKKARLALFIMIGIDVAAFFLFWLIQAYLRDPELAFAVMIVAAVGGAGYYIYEVRKLRDNS